ncbi:MAG TPA: hypothetical protein VNJ11_08155 [Bryobacteraceae bacterium]|nr:hypothetical protein [Bryobacteraceae bacterium]
MRVRVFTVVFFTLPGLIRCQQASTLRDVKKIYVDTFGTAEGADLIREKLINRLVRSGRVSVVEDPGVADAVLIGIGQIHKDVGYSASVWQYGGAASGGTRYDATLVVRLLGKDRQILWVDEAKPGFRARSVSSSVADKVSKNLLKAIEKANKQK